MDIDNQDICLKRKEGWQLVVCQSSIEMNCLLPDLLASSRLMSLDQTSKLDGSHCFISFDPRSPTRLAQ